MDQREYDIVLYGASGFTARFVIRELEKMPFKVLLCARTASKIPESAFPQVECTAEKIREVASRARVLINCAGPYAHSCAQIVEACIAARTHYLDICGETHVLRAVHERFHDEAAARNVRVVQACGFDSVPADIGAAYLSEHFDEVAVDSTIKLQQCTINSGTWLSLLNSLGSSTKRSSGSAGGARKVARAPPVAAYRYNQLLKAYDVPFKGSDVYVVKRTAEWLRSSGRCELRYSAYLSVGALPYLALYYIYGFIILLLSRVGCLRRYIAGHPELFSCGLVKRDGPTQSDISRARFTMHLSAVGKRAGKEAAMHLRIAGPDPGYISTAIFATQCVSELLADGRDASCGVLTPGQAFKAAALVDRLRSCGITFDIDRIIE
ncbi:hypothetical protein PAPHI01_1582 [Pancytospora philotis]|nr:hypothetical protein PAPHI01_1582 [Pancytospora philotis]